jgi:hypothetical protein
MLLELIARYYKFLWIGFAIVALLKIVLTSIFLGESSNYVVSLFKWFSADEREVEDEPSRKSMMRTLNLVSSIFYIIVLVILAATLLLFILKR